MASPRMRRTQYFHLDYLSGEPRFRGTAAIPLALWLSADWIVAVETFSWPRQLIAIRRGFASSTFGKTSVSTPSFISALILS